MKTYLKPIFIWLAATSTIVFTGGCEKSEGEGGRGSISGRIIEQRMDNFLNAEVEYEYYASEERVYIIYGDQTRVYDDDMRTDFDGRYRFRWLRPGTYTIFVYTECNVLYDDGCQEAGGSIPVIRTMQLDKNQDLVLEDIVIQNY